MVAAKVLDDADLIAKPLLLAKVVRIPGVGGVVSFVGGAWRKGGRVTEKSRR